jgi:hypothetical protein
LESPNIVNYYSVDKSKARRLFSLDEDNINFVDPFCHLREGEGLGYNMDLVKSLIVYYFVAVGALPFYEQMNSEDGRISLSLFKRVCELIAGHDDVDAAHGETTTASTETVRKVVREGKDDVDELQSKGRHRHLEDISSVRLVTWYPYLIT